METKIDENKLNELDDEPNKEPDGEPEGAAPIHKGSGDDYKETVQLKFRDGSEIQLGSCTVSVERLAEISHTIKLHLLNDTTKDIPNYFG